MKMRFEDFMTYCLVIGMGIIGLYIILYLGLKLYLTFRHDFYELKKTNITMECLGEETNSVLISDKDLVRCIEPNYGQTIYFKEARPKEEWEACVKDNSNWIAECGLRHKE